jgi:hypothetical protein
MNTTVQKVQINRINRKLASDHKRIVTSRGTRSRNALGQFYLLDTYRNEILDNSMDLDQFEEKLASDAKHKEILQIGIRMKYQEFIDRYSKMTPAESLRLPSDTHSRS